MKIFSKKKQETQHRERPNTIQMNIDLIESKGKLIRIPTFFKPYKRYYNPQTKEYYRIF